MKGVLQWLEKDDTLSALRNTGAKTPSALALSPDSGCGHEAEDLPSMASPEADAISLPRGIKGPSAAQLLLDEPTQESDLAGQAFKAHVMMPRLQLDDSPKPDPGVPSISSASTTGGSRCSVDGLWSAVSSSTEEKETEWTARMRSTGAVSRLVAYAAGDKPSMDFKFRGGEGSPVVVEAVRERSTALKCGVRPGDRLASIDGTKEFLALAADQVRSLLRAPTTLVFMGFVGQQRAEVQLNSNASICGFSAKENVFNKMPDAFVVCEETVFEPGSASLFFTTRLSEAEKSRTMQPTRARRKTTPANLEAVTPLFELRREEAHRIVHRAMLPEPVCAEDHSTRADVLGHLSKLEAHELLHHALDSGKQDPGFGSRVLVAAALPWHAAKQGQSANTELSLTNESAVGAAVNASASAPNEKQGGLTASRGRFQT